MKKRKGKEWCGLCRKWWDEDEFESHRCPLQDYPPKWDEYDDKWERYDD